MCWQIFEPLYYADQMFEKIQGICQSGVSSEVIMFSSPSPFPFRTFITMKYA
jgi:hypothetical protein